MFQVLMNLGNIYLEIINHITNHEFQAILMFMLHNITHNHVTLWGELSIAMISVFMKLGNTYVETANHIIDS